MCLCVTDSSAIKGFTRRRKKYSTSKLQKIGREHSKRCYRDKKWNLFKRWKSRPRIIVEVKLQNSKSVQIRQQHKCHAQSINFSSDFYLSNYECGFLFDFSSFDFLSQLVCFVGRCRDAGATVFLLSSTALAWTLLGGRARDVKWSTRKTASGNDFDMFASSKLSNRKSNLFFSKKIKVFLPCRKINPTEKN